MSEVSATAGQRDSRVFDEFVQPFVGELRTHCYRMLGSMVDADDALQETLVRAWRGSSRLREPGSRRPWLYTIATRVCLDEIQARGRRLLPLDLGPASEQVVDAPPLEAVRWIGPYPDDRLGAQDAGPEASYEQREAVELAFIAALQHLSGNQRAALVLFEVVGMPAAEIAATLGASVAAVNSALERARRTLEVRAPKVSQQRALGRLGDAALADLVTRFCAAFERNDVDLLTGLLAEDVTWSMPPLGQWYRGRESVLRFAARVPLGSCGGWRHLSTSGNAQPAIALYLRRPGAERFTAWSITLLTLEGDRLGAITSFLDPAPFSSFGLPAELA